MDLITFETTQGHGLVQGNQVRLTDTANNNVYGDYFVKEIDSPTKFTINNNTGVSLTNVTHVLKHGMSANNASADSLGENLGVRGLHQLWWRCIVLRSNDYYRGKLCSDSPNRND